MTDLPAIVAVEPFLLPTVWGGDALQRRFGKGYPADLPLGESWEISCVPGRESRIAGGPTLADAFRAAPHRFVPEGRAAAGFPLLVKLLATGDLLSVQVHPDDAAAARLDGAAAGKHEAWVVLHAEPDAELYVGLAPGATARLLCAAAARGDVAGVKACLRRVEPKKGDVYDIAPGTVHAPGRGLVLYEVQQPSDLTYRLFDWNRAGFDGKPRTLHVEKARAVIDDARHPLACAAATESDGADLLRTRHFHLGRLRPSERGETPLSGEGLRMVTAAAGAGEIVADGAPAVELSTGRTCVVLRDAKNVRLRGTGLDLFVASPAP
jgi:mannose-6-phosphate isomerase